jgi:putative ABC transport system permease protein
VQVANRELLRDAEYRIERTLRFLHNLDAGDENDFMIMNQARLLEIADNVSTTLTIFLGSIGAVSLLVGGIGIMNIMLVTVTERTREIGLRKAVGAHDRDILLQFLIEALTLTTLGGLVGAGFSYGIGLLVGLIPNAPFQIIIEVPVLLLALGVSLLCGFIFGLYPALQATRLNPIDALRYE